MSIGILTYQRPEAITSALASLASIATEGTALPPASPWSLVEVLVIDNDRTPSAEDAVRQASGPGVPVRYVHEPRPGLSAARNRALDEATTDVLVFIDDDEQAGAGWPGALIEVMTSTGAALVGGPVLTAHREEPPSWVVAGGYFDRDELPHGSTVEWLRSGNLAIDLGQIRGVGLHFDDAFAFTGGEDVAFTRTGRHRGLTLRWSAEGHVVEQVGPERSTLRWLTGRSRRAAAAYVRAELLNEASARRRLGVTVRGLGRCAQGVLTVLAGIVTLQSARVFDGLIVGCKGVGLLEGLVDHRAVAYRRDEGPVPPISRR